MYLGVEPLWGFTASFCPNPVAFQAELFCFLDSGPETLVHICNASLLIEWKLRSRAPKKHVQGFLWWQMPVSLCLIWELGAQTGTGRGWHSIQEPFPCETSKLSSRGTSSLARRGFFMSYSIKNSPQRHPSLSLSLCFRLGRRLAGWRQSCRRKATRWHCSVGKWWWSSEQQS